MMDEAAIQRIVEAAVRAATQTTTSQVQQLRKPDLPAFDKQNVDIWIKRIESAYARVNCTDPKLKFAHLEAKFDVNEDPKVNEFLFGVASQESWNDFLKYLRTRYGRTKRQEALSVINGTPREGRTPSQLAALMKDRAGSITLDDVMKEQLLKELPTEVQRQIVDKVANLTFQQTADLADAYFDKDGKQLHPSTSSTVNNVQRPPTRPPAARQPREPAASADLSHAPAPSTFSTPFFDDEDTDVNAVRFKGGKRQQFNVSNRSQSRGRGVSPKVGVRFSNNSQSRGSNTNSYGESSSYASSKSQAGGTSSSGEKPKVCRYHIKFGEQAQRCESWCMLASKHAAGKGQASQ